MNHPIARIRQGATILGVTVIAAIIGYRMLGNYTWMQSVYMVVITISTTGFGERSELSPELQALTVFVILVGMTAAAFVFGGVVQLMVEGEIARTLGHKKMTREIEKLQRHVIICGFGRIGQVMAAGFRQNGTEFVIVEQSSDCVDDARNKDYLAVHGDATDEDILLSAGVERAETLVSGLPNDALNVFITLTARTLNPEMNIVARADYVSSEKKLKQAGATRVVMPTIVGAKQMLRIVMRPLTADLMELVAETEFRDIELDELTITSTSKLIGMRVRETNAHRDYGLLVVAVKKIDGSMVFNPHAGYTFTEADVLIIMGQADDVTRFRGEYAL
ncbi:MAG: potassium channel protein [Pirellulaceae bacterium]|jgi:voltage-gated potassium channel|nr:potassium channel protein [Pirellulaceae bacterium]MDP7016687.1 potassium channel protein [Pirellulaceae bacterium]